MSYESCDLSGPEFFSESEHVSKKERQCVECSAPILSGERYLSIRGKWDGDFSHMAQHLLCRDACVWIRDVLDGECLYFGGLSEYMNATRYSFSVKIPKERIGMRMFAMIRRRELLAEHDAEAEKSGRSNG